jgi:hypothetical protein
MNVKALVNIPLIVGGRRLVLRPGDAVPEGALSDADAARLKRLGAAREEVSPAAPEPPPPLTPTPLPNPHPLSLSQREREDISLPSPPGGRVGDEGRGEGSKAPEPPTPAKKGKK